MNRTWPGWAIPALVVGLAGALLYGFNEHQLRSASLVQLESNYQAAFHGMVYDIDQMQDALASAQVTTSASFVNAQLRLAARHAAIGQTDSNRLPSVLSASGAISDFLGRVITTADDLANAHANGTKLTAGEQRTVQRLYTESTRLEGATRALQTDFLKSPSSFATVGANVEATDYRSLVRRIWALNAPSKRFPVSSVSSESAPPLGANASKKPQQGNAGIMTETQAIARAKEFAGAAARDPANVTRLGSGFDTPGYMVTVRQPGRRVTAVGLTLRSGQVLWMTTDEPPTGQTRFTVGQGLVQADRFLHAHGYASVVLKRQAHYGTTGTYTYAPLVKTVARESRPILVKVNLSDGRVTGFDASRAIGATTPPIALQPTISASVARRDLSPGFTVQKTRLAVLEPTGRQAILAYAFTGTSDGAAFEVWVNARDGSIVAVDKLTKTEPQRF